MMFMSTTQGGVGYSIINKINNIYNMIKLVNNCKQHNTKPNRLCTQPQKQATWSQQQDVSVDQPLQDQNSSSHRMLVHDSNHHLSIMPQSLAKQSAPPSHNMAGNRDRDRESPSFNRSKQKLNYINISINDVRLSDKTQSRIKVKDRQEHHRKISQQMAKNCLLSIDSDNKNNSGAIRAYSKKGKNCPTAHAYSNNSNSHHFNRSSYAKTSKGHQKWIVEHESTGPSGADHKIDIIRKKSSKDKGAFPYQLQQQNRQKYTKTQRFKYHMSQQENECEFNSNWEQANEESNNCLNPNKQKNTYLKYAQARSNRSLSNFQLLKLQAEDLQKSNIVLGVKEHLNANSNESRNGDKYKIKEHNREFKKKKTTSKICVKQYMKIHAHKESHMNINMSINKSTHRSRYKQSLTNRKISDQRQVLNCNQNSEDANQCQQFNRGKKVMNRTMDNMKKYHNKIRQQTQQKLSTQSINNHPDHEFYCHRHKKTYTQANVNAANQISCPNQNIYNSQMGNPTSKQLKHGCLSQAQASSFSRTKTSKYRTGGDAYKKFSHEWSTQAMHNVGKGQNQDLDQQTTCKCHCGQQSSQALLQKQKKISIESRQMKQSIDGYQNKNFGAEEGWQNENKNQELRFNKVNSYGDAYCQNETINSNMRNTIENKTYTNQYVINNEFIPLANRSVLDKNRHNIKKINKNINRLLAHRNNNNLNSLIRKSVQNKKNISLCNNENQNVDDKEEGAINYNNNRVNIDEFIKSKLNIGMNSHKNNIGSNRQQNQQGKTILSTKNIIEQINKYPVQKQCQKIIASIHKDKEDWVKSSNRNSKARNSNNNKSTSSPSLVKAESNWDMNVTGNSLTVKDKEGKKIDNKNVVAHTNNNKSECALNSLNTGSTRNQNKNAARFYKNQVQKFKDKANIIYFDPHLKTKAIDIIERDKKNENNQIVIICL